MRLLRVLFVSMMGSMSASSLSQPSIELQRNLQVKVETYAIKSDNLITALTTIATEFQIPMGIEWVRDLDTRRLIARSWKDLTVSEIIRSLVNDYPGYEVRIGRVVEILPVALADAHDFLSVHVAGFRAKDEWLAFASQRLRLSIVPLIRYVPPSPPQAASGGSMGVGVGGKSLVNIDVKDTAVRDILSDLALSAGHTSWVVTYPEVPSIMPSGFRRTVPLYSNTVLEDEVQPVWTFVPWGIPVPDVK